MIYERYSNGYAAPIPLASPGERLVAQMVDVIVAGVFLVVALFVIPYLDILSWNLGSLGTVVGAACAAAYLLFADGMHAGQSYGKRIKSIAVVDARSGMPCSYGQSALRNLVSGMLGPIDWVFLLGAERRRLGDRAAGTMVVQRSI